MLKELLSNDNFIFIAVHAFLIGIAIGVTVCYQIIRNIKKQLVSQSKAYEDLLQSTSIEFPPVRQQSKRIKLEVVHLENEHAQVASLAI
jgi:hypothetical protein